MYVIWNLSKTQLKVMNPSKPGLYDKTKPSVTKDTWGIAYGTIAVLDSLATLKPMADKINNTIKPGPYHFTCHIQRADNFQKIPRRIKGNHNSY